MRPAPDDRAAFASVRWMCIRYSMTVVTASLDHRRRARQMAQNASNVCVKCGTEGILIYICPDAIACVIAHNDELYANGVLQPKFKLGDSVRVVSTDGTSPLYGTIGAIIPLKSSFSESYCVYGKSAFMYLPEHGWKDKSGNIVSVRAIEEDLLEPTQEVI